MYIQYFIEIVMMLAALFLVFKICQLINVCIKEVHETEKLRRDLMRMDVRYVESKKKKLNEEKK